ncbi:LptM family lipoprotein, partial [Psychrobacter sp.]|uniref:LptM family lipoprotein n=1 Tax=Psychrobacter sp. TaxID=56811 RepID=UPI002FD92F14
MKPFKLALLALSTAFLIQGCGDDSDSYQPPQQQPDITSEVTGLWTSNDSESDLLALAFFEDGSYIHVEVENRPEPLLRRAFTIQSEDDTDDGMEWGKYTIDNKTGALKVNQVFDDNGENGLSENLTQYISVSEGVLTIQIDENNNGVIDSNESFSFSKAKNDGYLGIWRGEETDEELDSVAFFEDGTYIQLKVDAEKSLDNLENGMEWGDYTVDDNSGRLETYQIFDDNGISGFSESLERYLKTSNDKLTLDIDKNQDGIIDQNESFDFSKNKPVVKPTSKKIIGLWENRDTNNELLA